MVYLVTNHSGLNGALKRYGKRWPLETPFGFLKSRDFDLESTHLTDPKRLKMLIGVLTLCLLWGLRVGEVLNQKNQPHVRNTDARLSAYFDWA